MLLLFWTVWYRVKSAAALLVSDIPTQSTSLLFSCLFCQWNDTLYNGPTYSKSARTTMFKEIQIRAFQWYTTRTITLGGSKVQVGSQIFKWKKALFCIGSRINQTSTNHHFAAPCGTGTTEKPWKLTKRWILDAVEVKNHDFVMVQGVPPSVRFQVE